MYSSSKHSRFERGLGLFTARRLAQRGVVALAVLTTAATAAAGELKFPLLWQTDLQSFIESAATVADLNGDGRDKMLVAGREELFALDGRGKQLWHWRTKGRFMTYPAVLTRSGQASLIFAADNSGLFTCLDGAGKEVWHAQLKGPSSWSASVICDLDRDGSFEVIQTDETGMVWAFAALTGKVLWQTKIKGIPVSPAVGDIDGDGKPEIVVATGDGIVTALNGKGQVLWERTIGGSSPMVRSHRTWPFPLSAVTMPSPVATTISGLPSPSMSPTAGLTGMPLIFVCQRTLPVSAAKAHTMPVSSVWMTSKLPSRSRSQITEADQLEGPFNCACQTSLPAPSRQVNKPLLSAAKIKDACPDRVSTAG